MPVNKYAAPSSSSERIAPVPRVCQAYARCATPLTVNNHPKRIVIAIPAIGGMMTARMPAMIMTTLSAMTHPKDFLRIADGVSVVVLMLNPPSISKDRMSRCHQYSWCPRQGVTITDSLLFASTFWRYNNKYALALVHDSEQR